MFLVIAKGGGVIRVSVPSVTAIEFNVTEEAGAIWPSPFKKLNPKPIMSLSVTLSGKPVAWKLELIKPLSCEFTKELSVIKLPDNEVSQYISNNDSTGFVSAIDKNGTIDNTAVGKGIVLTESVVT